ncbi:ATP-binding cassette domain-containing protein [Acidocella sp.]|jgi:D-xylose transport system ATP-binding protein|uniref:ATP-binding cassette domain-containing protein n=1 Tax=Acidocella sp. TaxID=50710 RepID=UPI002622D850|nr:ATP-binding cassette domain-containing protein [Acidocella sp.]
MEPSSGQELLKVQHLHKKYGAVIALRDVSFTVQRGEIVALLGDNGAGKSTTIKAISGAAPADSGQIFLDGHEVTIRRPADANALGIQTVYQDLALCDNLGICANLFLGRELVSRPLGFGPGLLREVDMEEEGRRVLKTLRVNLPSLDTPVAALSGGQRQAVAIARAVLWGTKLVIMDEPTAALGVAQTAEVLRLVRDLAAHGFGVILITHNMQNVFEVADKVVVLRLGETVLEGRKKDLTPEDVVSCITGSRTTIGGMA